MTAPGDELPEPPRLTPQRIADTLARLEHDVDLWVASANEAGDAYLVPLSFHWDGSRLTMATPRTSRTARNLMRAGWARVALGETRDVVVVEGPVEAIALGTEPELEEAHAISAGFDPRELAEEYVYLRITPHEIQAWREANELEGRLLMRDGIWLEGDRDRIDETPLGPMKWPPRSGLNERKHPHGTAGLHPDT